MAKRLFLVLVMYPKILYFFNSVQLDIEMPAGQARTFNLQRKGQKLDQQSSGRQPGANSKNQSEKLGSGADF